MWRLRPSVIRGAIWALWSYRQAKHQLKRGVAAPVIQSPPPGLPLEARRGVEGVLKRVSATCLEGALVRQEWMASRGEPRDIVIGVPHEGLLSEPAHAWVDGTDVASPLLYAELHRIAPRGRPTESDR